MSPVVALEKPDFYCRILPVFTTPFTNEHVWACAQTKATCLFTKNLEFGLKKVMIIFSPDDSPTSMICFEEEEKLESKIKKMADRPSSKYRKKNESHGNIHTDSLSESFLNHCLLGTMSYP